LRQTCARTSASRTARPAGVGERVGSCQDTHLGGHLDDRLSVRLVAPRFELVDEVVDHRLAPRRVARNGAGHRRQQQLLALGPHGRGVAAGRAVEGIVDAHPARRGGGGRRRT